MEVIKAIPNLPRGLRDAALRGTLIPFVGAGASRIAGCPNWSEFADGALRFFVDQGKFSHGQLAQISYLNPRVKLSIARGASGRAQDFRRFREGLVSHWTQGQSEGKTPLRESLQAWKNIRHHQLRRIARHDNWRAGTIGPRRLQSGGITDRGAANSCL